MPDYFQAVAERLAPEVMKKTLRDAKNKEIDWKKWDAETRRSQICEAVKTSQPLKNAASEQLKALAGANTPEPSEDKIAKFVSTEYGIARLIESIVGGQSEEDDEASA